MGLIARLVISADNAANKTSETLRLYPIFSDNRKTRYQPRFVDAKEFTRALNTINDRSDGSVKFGYNKDHFGQYLEVPVKAVNCR